MHTEDRCCNIILTFYMCTLRCERDADKVRHHIAPDYTKSHIVNFIKTFFGNNTPRTPSSEVLPQTLGEGKGTWKGEE